MAVVDATGPIWFGARIEAEHNLRHLPPVGTVGGGIQQAKVSPAVVEIIVRDSGSGRRLF